MYVESSGIAAANFAMESEHVCLSHCSTEHGFFTSVFYTKVLCTEKRGLESLNAGGLASTRLTKQRVRGKCFQLGIVRQVE